MSRPDGRGLDELIDLITRKVVEELSGSGRADTPAAASSAGPAPSPAAMTGHAPAGSPPAGEHDPDTCERCRTWGVCGVRNSDETRALAAAGAERVVATVGYC